MPSLVENFQVFNVHVRQCILLFRNYLPLEKGMVLYLNKLECFVLSLVEINPVVLEQKFLISSIYFLYFVIISHWKRAWSFI